ncbi:calcium-responsive transactivator isoform X7 [Takifugu rubripes]|uniref:calcium-responsive transactivator isoform X7 n=1 Tax=Takifugu rubripes TaxID=31033 RepID=UPI001145881B|nr:calcium-responsive transactivator isoform X7 [Takifugu rubripes]
MSVAFPSARPRSKGEVTQQAIQKMLDENHHLIQCIMDHQSKGKLAECTQYQQILHRNLVYLATIADSNQNMQSLLPAPPTANMSMGPGGISQGGNLNDNGPPTSMMPSQMSNGAGHAHMQQQPANPNSSFGSSASGYSHPTPLSQGSTLQGPGPGHGSSSSSAPSSSSCSHSNHNMQSHRGEPAQAGGQHYQGQSAMGMMGQGAPGNTMMSQRPMGNYRSSQQGHGEYSYQPPPYGDQGYDRPFEESSQHYYEGGNSQYGQQQAQYQPGSGQQPFSQQQYSSQQGYGGQPQGYAPGQAASSQYSQFQQGQGQQYGSYRSSQGGPGAQPQRSYAYEQGQYGNYQQ